jgi:prolyl oligopeptidase
MRRPLLAALLAVAAASSCAPRGPAAGVATGASAAEPSSAASAALHAVFAAEWDYAMREWPTRASELGDRRFDDRWPDVSPAAFERRAAHTRELLVRLRAYERRDLPAEDRLSLRLLTRETELDAEGEPFRLWLLAVNQREGIQTADDLADALPFATLHDYEAWIARLRALPVYVEQTEATLREGARARIVQPRVVMERVPAQIDKQIVVDPEQSPFFAPLRKLAAEDGRAAAAPGSLGEADRRRLVREAKAAIAEAVVPAYRRFKDFFVREYLPACFPEVGAWQWPRGDDAYVYLVRLHSTTRMTPSEVHDVGLREVARIRSEMLALATKLEFKGTLSDFFAWLRTDPRFFYPDAASLFEAYAATAKRIDPRLVLLFKTLPRTPYGVEAIPAAVAPDTTTAYYRGPAADGSRAGTFFVNLYKPEARPKWEMTALALHESVPGHHLQIALAAEQRGLPDFRRHDSWTAFVEGWGLYAESLGDEMGLYDDPYAKFGQLTYDMWRAVRLVVDTGIHAMRWDRKRAIEYFLAATPKTELDVTNEVDRYIAWPGQAVAYKIGQLEIQRLRNEAQARLGARFDVREFHDVVLRDGALPLDVLEERVKSWMSREMSGPRLERLD